MDDIRLYNYALTGAEIKALYDEERTVDSEDDKYDDGDNDCSNWNYTLPHLITDNDVKICLRSGSYKGDLTVNGNNYTLIGDAGFRCEDNGWTTIEGNVEINGKNAIFKNIRFTGDIDERGNSTNFINCCFF